MYDRRPPDVTRTFHHLVPWISCNWVLSTSRGRPPSELLELEHLFFSVKNSNRSVKQGLLHLKNTFFIKLSIFVLVP